jgi:hypothetical protein
MSLKIKKIIFDDFSYLPKIRRRRGGSVAATGARGCVAMSWMNEVGLKGMTSSCKSPSEAPCDVLMKRVSEVEGLA